MAASSSSPVYFKTIDLASVSLGPLQKDGRIYSAALAPGPLLVQTPPVPIQSLAEGVAWLLPSGPFRAFLRETEATLKAKSSAEAEAWSLSPGQVDTSFKTFFKHDAFKVRLHPDFAAFSPDGEYLESPDGVTTARLVLELDKVSVGKTEMGCLWRLVQLRATSPPPPCLIDFDVELPDDAEVDGHTNDDEFV